MHLKVNPWHGLLKLCQKSYNLWLSLIDSCHKLTNASMPFIVWMLSCYGMHIGERKNGMCVVFCRMWVKSIMFGRIRYTIFCRMFCLCDFYLIIRCYLYNCYNYYFVVFLQLSLLNTFAALQTLENESVWRKWKSEGSFFFLFNCMPSNKSITLHS